MEVPPTSTTKVGDLQISLSNDAFLVSVRTLKNGVRHLRVISPTLERPSWWEMQRIKNEIVGPGETAVEVYPPEDETVDGVCLYHLWVLPMGARLPFSLFDFRDDPIEDSILGAVAHAGEAHFPESEAGRAQGSKDGDSQ